MSNIGDDNNNMLESCSSTSTIRRSSSIWTSGTRKSQASLQHQKENHQNQQQLVPQRQIPPESINSNATRCGTMSKEQSLSSIRDVGCTNPMAYTLWHHSIVDTNMSDAEWNVDNDEHWIIHENWELLNSIDTSYYDKLSKEIDAFAIVDNEHNYDNISYRYGEQHPSDAIIENNGNVAPSLFVPVTMTRQSNVDDIIDDNHFNNINDNIDLPVSNRMTAINLIHDHNNTGNNDTIHHHHHRRRRHTVSGYNITKPIAIRPITTSATSLSINTIPK